MADKQKAPHTTVVFRRPRLETIDPAMLLKIALRNSAKDGSYTLMKRFSFRRADLP